MWTASWRWEPCLFCSGQIRDESWLPGNTFIYLFVLANGSSAWMIFREVDVCTAEEPPGPGLSRWWAYRDEDSDTRDITIFGLVCLKSGNHCGYQDHNLSRLASRLAKYVRDSMCETDNCWVSLSGHKIRCFDADDTGNEIQQSTVSLQYCLLLLLMNIISLCW